MKKRRLLFQFLLFFFLLFYWTCPVIATAEETTIFVSIDCANVVDNDVRVYLAQTLIHTFTFVDGETSCSGSFTTEDLLAEGVNTFTFGTGDAATDAHAVPYYVNFGLKNPVAPIITAGTTLLSWTAGAGEVAGYSVFYDTTRGGLANEVDVGIATSLDLSTLDLPNGRYFFTLSPYDTTGYYGKSTYFTVISINGAFRISSGIASKVILMKKRRAQ